MEGKPDAVILALGGVPIKPDIPGINGPQVVTAQDVLCGKKQTGQNVVVIGGGLVGCETGHYLAEKGKKITIVEMLKRMAAEMGPNDHLLKTLQGRVPEVHCVGDASQPQGIMEAVRDGYLAALSV